MLKNGFFSYTFGSRSAIAKLINIIGANLTNIIYSVIAVAYISHILFGVFAGISVVLATSIATGLLLCAAPFELMDTFTHNKPANVERKHLPKWLKRYPTLLHIFGMLFSVMGAVQFFIRQYVLMVNFSSTTVASKLFGLIASKAAVVFEQVVSKSYIIGGVLGSVTHFLVSYIGWDKVHDVASNTRSYGYYYVLQIFLPKLVWSGLAVFAFAPFIGWYHALLILASTYIFSALMYIVYAQVKAPKSKGKVVEEKTAAKPKSRIFFVLFASVMLPVGASLYTLVDFFNAFKVMQALNVGLWASLGAGVTLGLISFAQVFVIWGFNTLLFLFESGGDKGPKVDEQYPRFTQFFYSRFSVRRVLSYVRELILAGLDVLNNIFSYQAISAIFKLALGFSLPLMVLHLCSIATLLNRMVVLYFQSAPVKTKIVAKEPSTFFSKVTDKIVGHSFDNQSEADIKQPVPAA